MSDPVGLMEFGQKHSQVHLVVAGLCPVCLGRYIDGRDGGAKTQLVEEVLDGVKTGKWICPDGGRSYAKHLLGLVLSVAALVAVSTMMLLAWLRVISLTLVMWVSVSLYVVLTIATWRRNPLSRPGLTMDFVMALLGAATMVTVVVIQILLAR
jgi:hypothetical protein